MIEACYSVIQYVADLIRNEPINVGVLVQTPSHLSLRTLDNLSHLRERLSRADLTILTSLSDTLSQRLLPRDQMIYDFKTGREVRVKNTERAFLEFLTLSYDRQLQFSQIRPCFVQRDRPSDVEELLESLYLAMVEPGESVRPRISRPRSYSLRAALRRAFRPLIEMDLVREEYRVRASVTHIIPFYYHNSARVLIDTVQLDLRSGAEQLKRTQACLFKWMDISQTLQRDEYKKAAVYYPPATMTKEYQECVTLLKRYSDQAIDFKEEGENFIQRVFADLGQ